MLCTDSVDQQGDGSALMCKNNLGLWEVHGVYSSHGNSVNHNRRPQVITSVKEVREWLDVTVGRFNLF